VRLLGVHRLHYRKGGAEAVHLDHLALFRERGWQCAEFAMEHPNNEPSEWSGYFPKHFDPPLGIGGITSVPRFLYSREAQQKFAQLLDDFKPDIIHSHGMYQQLTGAIMKPAMARGIPVVYTLHEFKLICPTYHFYNERIGVCEQCGGGRQWRCLSNRCSSGALARDALLAFDGLVQWYSGVIRNGVSSFVGPSRFIVDKFAEHGFPRAKLHYVPNFFESCDDAPADAALVASLKEKHGRYLVYFGRLSDEKGINLLIDAAAEVGIPLVVVGDGPMRADLEAQAERCGGACVFTGHLTGARLWAHVEASLAVVLPSVWFENAPKSILEALARGKPVITARIGGLPEIVEDGATGFLAQASNGASLVESINRLLALRDDEIRAMGALAQTRVLTTFTRERYYREICAIYGDLAPRTRSS